MNVRNPLSDLKIRATTVAAVLTAVLVGAVALQASTAVAQSTIPANLTKLRPIKGIAYDPKPSDFFTLAYFDSDFFNSDFTAIWGDDGQAGARRDLKVFQDAGLNFLHLYNWNAQRVNHTAFLDEANTRGMKVMVPISNFTAQSIEGPVPDCPTCPLGYQAAFNLVKGIFDQVYLGTTTPHPAAAMWGIYNEYDLNKISPIDVAFAVQAILTLEDQAGIPAANRLPITSPVSDAIWDVDHRQGLTRAQAQFFKLATDQWLATNPGKNVGTPPPDGLPGAVIAILALSNAFALSTKTTSYQSVAHDPAPVTVSPIPADFWKTRWIASSNPFREGPALEDFITNPAQFQSAFPGTTAWNTLPPLFFAEMGFAQVDAGAGFPPPQPPSSTILAKQASVVLGQVQATNALAVSGNTPQGYFLGSAFFQHTFVDKSHFEALSVVPGQFSPRAASGTAPCPACGVAWRVDVLTPYPQWTSVTTGYASALEDEPAESE